MMRRSLPDCTFNLDHTIPATIYIPEKTYLGRWGESDRSLDAQTTDDGSIGSSIDSNRSRMLQGESQAPQAPTRTFDDSPRNSRTWWKKSADQNAARATKVQKHLAASMQTGVNIGSIVLQPLQFHKPQGDEQAALQPVTLASASTLSDVILTRRRPVDDARSLTGIDASIHNDDTQLTAVFCIRRAGCGSCREQGMQLGQLTEELAQGENGIKVNLFGIIKDNTGACEQEKLDTLVSEFYSDYFPYPLYQDKDWDAFKFLGNRKLSVWKILQAAPKLAGRFSEKEIDQHPFGGDIFTQGGVLLFDRAGQLKYVYYERYGDELDMEALRWAIQDVAAGSTAGARKLKREARDSRISAALMDKSMSSLSSAPQLPTRHGSFHLSSRNTNRGFHDKRISATSTMDKSMTSLSSGAPQIPTRRGSFYSAAGEKPMEKVWDDSNSAGSKEKSIASLSSAPRLPTRRGSFQTGIPMISEHSVTEANTKAPTKPERRSINSRIRSALTESISSISWATKVPARRRSSHQGSSDSERAPRMPIRS